MTEAFDNVQVLGLLIQAMGAALIGLLCELSDAVRHADAVMYARRRERALAAMPAGLPIVAVPGADTLESPGALSTFGDG
jgi:hypothetical protein